MATQIQFRRGTTNQHNSFTGATAEVTVNTTNKSVHVHDGTTQGGFELARADLSNASGLSLAGLTTVANLKVSNDLYVSGVSTFVGAVTFQGGTITLGDANTDNVVFTADVNSNIIPNTDATYDFGSSSQRWRNAIFSGIVTATTFSGTATSTTNVPNLTGDVTSNNTVTTLATVNSNVGTFGSSTSIPSITVNSKGLVTGVTTNSITVGDGTLTLATSGTGLNGSASFTANQSGSSTFTVTSNATNANTASTLVSRDSSGNFIAGVITATTFSGALQGNASTVTALNSTWAQVGSGLTFTTGIATNFTVSGVGTITTLNATGAAVTALNSTWAQVGSGLTFTTGIATNFTVSGVATVTQLVSTNVNITGIATFNQSNPTNLSVSGIGTITTELNIGVGGTTFTAVSSTGFVGVNTTTSTGTTNQRLQVIGGAYVSGNIGVGITLPTSTLHVQGDARISGVITATDFNTTSDINLKENIRPIDNSAQIINELEGVRFVWKADGKESIGVIAQEIEKTLPELVSNGDIKTVNYNGLIGVLIEAVKDQQKQINELKIEIENLKK